MSVKICHCNRCGKEWPARKDNPKRCPGCKSPYWNKKRMRPAESYSKRRKARLAYA